MISVCHDIVVMGAFHSLIRHRVLSRIGILNTQTLATLKLLDGRLSKKASNFYTLNNKVKYIDTKQSNKRNNQNSKDKRQDYNMK